MIFCNNRWIFEFILTKINTGISSNCKLIKRIRSGIPITDKKLFIGIPSVDHYIFNRWLKNNFLFNWAVFKSIKAFHAEINNFKLFIKFQKDKEIISIF